MTRRLYQRRLTDRPNSDTPVFSNIEAAGDKLTDKDRHTIRLAFQNIHGATNLRGGGIASEIDAMEELKIDIMGMAETNRPWTPEQRALHDAYMNRRFRASRTVYTAAPTDQHNATWQAGGNLITVNGEITGRIDGHMRDKWGRFCWYSFQGKRNEGVVVIVAYRVCQEKHHKPGKHTAYHQQYVALRESGCRDPNPRQQILDDLSDLIQEKRALGYCPILMIDANGDYTQGHDVKLATFLTRTHLSDPYRDHYPNPIRTYIRGSSRIDYIFMDRALTHSIINIGYLASHEGAESDHVLAYVDMNQQSMFGGLINRPPPAHSREILIEQEDKVQDFLRALKPLFEYHKLERRVFELAGKFAEYLDHTSIIKEYNTVYGQFLEIVKGVAHQIGRKKYGYMQSPVLTTAGNYVLSTRYLWDCKQRGTPPTKRLLALGHRLKIDVQEMLNLSERDLRKKMRESRRRLWECQKKCESLREEWLAGEAMARATAAGDMDWERRLQAMKRNITRSAVNRKLTALTKGNKGPLWMIQVPTHDWFYSEQHNKLYWYYKGVFEAYPAAPNGGFYSHHTRKVLPSEVHAVEVFRDDSMERWKIATFLPLPDPLWKDVTSGEDIEQELLQRNHMHLEQVSREGSVSTDPLLTELWKDFGFNALSKTVLDGEPVNKTVEKLAIEAGRTVTEYTITPEIAAFFQALRKTEIDQSLTPILGTISSMDFQKMFMKACKRTSSDPRMLNYTLWKCLAKSDKFSGFISVLLSLPFVYGFVNDHWTTMVDFMLEKKPGVRQIHTLRIIGKVPAEFNTCLKFLIGKQARDNFEKTDTCDEQHGFRPHRSAQDAMMLKLLTFESARMQKCTIGSLQHDMTSHFDRMYPELTSIYATKYAVSESVMTSIGKTIASLRRNIETSVGISKGTYGQEEGAPRLGGMVQGKADVPQFPHSRVMQC
jgi:hypothetical protein